MKRRDKIEYVGINGIREYSANAKKHPEQQISLLAKGIERFGFNQPIVIDKNYEIVAGHGRFLAAKKLGMQEIPCIRVDDLSDAEVRAYRLADNKLNAMTEFDIAGVINELAAINAEGLDLELTGFDPKLLDMNFEPDKSGKVRMDVTQTVKCPKCGYEHEIKR